MVQVVGKISNRLPIGFRKVECFWQILMKPVLLLLFRLMLVMMVLLLIWRRMVVVVDCCCCCTRIKVLEICGHHKGIEHRLSWRRLWIKTGRQLQLNRWRSTITAILVDNCCSMKSIRWRINVAVAFAIAIAVARTHVNAYAIEQ